MTVAHLQVGIRSTIPDVIQPKNFKALIQSQHVAVDCCETIYSLQMATIASTLRTVLPIYLQTRTQQLPPEEISHDASHGESGRRWEGLDIVDTHMLKTFFWMRFATSSDNIGSSPRSSTSQAWSANTNL